LSKNYYKILGVDKDAEQETLKKVYRQLSKEHHPDHGGDEERFKEISEAYSVLSDPQKRKEYDNPMQQGGGFSFHDIFGSMGGNRGPFGPPNPNAPRRGQNIMLEHLAPLRSFILGGKIKINLSFRDHCSDCAGTGAEEKETCSNCNGTGQVVEVQSHRGMRMQSARPCHRCRGRGFIAIKQCEPCKGQGSVAIDKELELEVPPGTTEGHVIGVRGGGGSGFNGGPNGDLGVKLHIQMPDPSKLTEEQRKVLEEL